MTETPKTPDLSELDASGHHTTHPELLRLGFGLTFNCMLSAIPWVALTAVILPAVLENIDPINKESMLGLTNAAGAVVALIANVVFGALSDLTRPENVGEHRGVVVEGDPLAMKVTAPLDLALAESLAAAR